MGLKDGPVLSEEQARRLSERAAKLQAEAARREEEREREFRLPASG
jgi:hypothetical protein